MLVDPRAHGDNLETFLKMAGSGLLAFLLCWSIHDALCFCCVLLACGSLLLGLRQFAERQFAERQFA